MSIFKDMCCFSDLEHDAPGITSTNTLQAGRGIEMRDLTGIFQLWSGTVPLGSSHMNDLDGA